MVKKFKPRFCYATGDSFALNSSQPTAGFANTKMVLVFACEEHREEYLETTNFSNARKIAKKETMKFSTDFAFWKGVVEGYEIPYDPIKRSVFTDHQWMIHQEEGKDFAKVVPDSVCRRQQCICADKIFQIKKVE